METKTIDNMKVQKINDEPKGVVWEAVEDGHHTIIQNSGIAVDILLRVGHGLSPHWNVIGCAELSITKTDSPIITERLNFSAHPDFMGNITGEFYDTDGITENCGGSWDIDNVEMHDPSETTDGDERNDDIMKRFVEKYVAGLVYVDELNAAHDENFCLEEE